MLIDREMVERPPVLARAEPDDEYEYPMPEPLDPWTIEREEHNQINDDFEDEDEE